MAAGLTVSGAAELAGSASVAASVVGACVTAVDVDTSGCAADALAFLPGRRLGASAPGRRSRDAALGVALSAPPGDGTHASEAALRSGERWCVELVADLVCGLRRWLFRRVCTCCDGVVGMVCVMCDVVTCCRLRFCFVVCMVGCGGGGGCGMLMVGFCLGFCGALLTTSGDVDGEMVQASFGGGVCEDV